MAAVHSISPIKSASAMMTPWRKRRMCMILSDAPAPAALREISGTGAFLETNARPPLESRVCFHHPEAGAIDARVTAIASDGIRISFAAGIGSMAFALAAIAADMTQG